jgi:hypothetical protein
VPEQAAKPTWFASRPTLAFVIATTIVVAYVAAEVLLFSVHEPWRDEAQAWLIAGDLRTPVDFLIIPGEGHPPVWFWLMRLLRGFLSFDQARLVMFGVVAANAVLLARLLRDQPLVLITALCSIALLHYWGFYFRPYALIVTCVAAALLLDRAGRPVAATWVLALSCGLHFYSGFLLAFWLLIQLRRGTAIVRLIAPSLLALAFALTAILSGRGNPAGIASAADLFPRFISSFAALFPIPLVGPILNIAIVVLILAFGLRRSPFVLITLMGLLLVFAGFATVVYGFAPWHVSFALLLVVMAWTLSRSAPGWVLALLLLPLDVAGVERSIADAQGLTSPDELAYAAVSTDAGARFDPARNLIAWPDFLLTPAAARHDIRYLSGNNGTVIGAVDWRNRGDGNVDAKLLTTLPTPYWLVCSKCEPALQAIKDAGHTTTEILPLTRSLIEPIAAYRVD